jgi:hypothetical protein
MRMPHRNRRQQGFALRSAVEMRMLYIAFILIVQPIFVIGKWSARPCRAGKQPRFRVLRRPSGTRVFFLSSAEETVIVPDFIGKIGIVSIRPPTASPLLADGAEEEDMHITCLMKTALCPG